MPPRSIQFYGFLMPPALSRQCLDFQKPHLYMFDVQRLTSTAPIKQTNHQGQRSISQHSSNDAWQSVHLFGLLPCAFGEPHSWNPWSRFRWLECVSRLFKSFHQAYSGQHEDPIMVEASSCNLQRNMIIFLEIHYLTPTLSLQL
jgi:hypothetical protein